MLVDCSYIKSDRSKIDHTLYEAVGDIALNTKCRDTSILIFFFDIVAWGHVDRSFRDPNKIKISELEYLILLDDGKSLNSYCIECIGSQAFNSLTSRGVIEKEVIQDYLEFTKNNTDKSYSSINHYHDVVNTLKYYDSVSIYDIERSVDFHTSTTSDITSKYSLKKIKRDLIIPIREDLVERGFSINKQGVVYAYKM